MENAKKFSSCGSNNENRINQAHGYAFGEGMDCSKAATYTKSAACHMNTNNNNASSSSGGMMTVNGCGGGCASSSSTVGVIGGGAGVDDPNLKLTHMSSSSSAFDIKVKRKRACQMKVLVVLLAMMSAACIACLVAFFYIRFQHENELHFNYTRNMVMERACKNIIKFLFGLVWQTWQILFFGYNIV